MKQIRLLFVVVLSLLSQMSFAQFYYNGPDIIYTHDKIGIGLNNPDGKLHVNGGVRVNDWLRVGGNTDGYAWKMGVNGNIITRNGKVILGAAANDRIGLGTTNPAYKLHSKGDIYADGGWFRVSGNRGIYFQSYGGGFYMKDNSWIRTYGNKNFYHNTGIMRTDGTFQVGPNGNRFEVQTNGNVGIGTTNAQGALHILKSGAPVAGLPSEQNGLMLGINNVNSYKWIQSYGGVLSLNPRGNNVSIGTTSSYNHKLYVNGSAAKPGSSFWSVYSDKRLKDNVKNFDDGLEVLKQIRPVWFSYNEKSGLSTDERYVGVIAQEVKEAAPYMVSTSQMEDEAGKSSSYLSYDANALLYILVNSVQEQQMELEERDQQLATLTDEVSELKELVKQLMEDKKDLKEDAQPQIHTQNVELSDAMLEQNRPNPFNQRTTIPYFIPENVQEAILNITAATGQVIKTIDIDERGFGETVLQAQTFSPGTYLYTLILDGKIAETKRMILTGK